VVGTKKIGLLSLDNPHHLAIRNIFFREEYYDDPAPLAPFADAGLDWQVASVGGRRCALYPAPVVARGGDHIPRLRVDGGSALALTAGGDCPRHLQNGGRPSRHYRQGRGGECAALIDAARQLGLEKELAIAWQMGN
jgi:hypothetical protein